MEVKRSYVIWASELQACKSLTAVASLPKIRVYTREGSTVVLTSKGIRYDIKERLSMTYRGLNCIILQFGDSVRVVFETGFCTFWGEYLEKFAELSPLFVNMDEKPVARMTLDGSKVHCVFKSGDTEDYESEWDPEFGRPEIPDIEVIVNSEDLNNSSSIPKLLLSEVVEEVPEEENQSKVGLVWQWFTDKPVLLTFTASLLVFGIVFFFIYLRYVPKETKPVVDPFIVEDSDWEFPEAREHKYPGFEFLDRIDPHDEFGMTTKEDAPVPRTMPEAKKLNEDVKGWLKVPGTSISSPVLWTDLGNNYYIGRNILKQQVFSGNTTGVIFADTNNILSNRNALNSNTVIYGHNWTNTENAQTTARINSPKDKQFGPLLSFSDKTFANKYRRIVLTTEDGRESQFGIFAVFYCDVNSSQFFQYNATNLQGAEFMSLINKARAASLWVYPGDVTETDKIITLSTCSTRYSHSGSGRFVVMGKLVESQGSISSTPLKENTGDDAYIPVSVEKAEVENASSSSVSENSVTDRESASSDTAYSDSVFSADNPS